MRAVISAISLSLRQLGDRAILSVLAKSVAITVALFVAAGYGVSKALPWLVSDYLDLSSDTYVVLSALLMLAGAWFLFRVVAIAVIQLFADEIVIAVERKHYPAAAHRARKLPLSEDISNSLRSIGRTIGVNLVAIPVALLLIPTAIGPAIAFFGANAVLLGRELTDMAWLRQRIQPDSANPVHLGERLLLGSAIAGMMLVPFANFLAPVIGAAAGTHLVNHRFGRHDP